MTGAVRNSCAARAWVTYSGAIRGLPIFFVVVPDFVKIVLVQLADKAGEVAVLEMLGEDVFGKLLVLSHG